MSREDQRTRRVGSGDIELFQGGFGKPGSAPILIRLRAGHHDSDRTEVAAPLAGDGGEAPSARIAAVTAFLAGQTNAHLKIQRTEGVAV